ncbi:MAG: hypothetical protein L6R37_004074 [Teloschistes peruensis]|nr:MAG: hypothetical protein L6R37_004074 [Teloschistes peruensis]
MTTDYSKKKNAELEELLKARSLPHTGKKAELIARLQQSDKGNASSKPASTKEIPPEDEIDWDDDAVIPEETPATTKKSDASIPAKTATTPAAATAIAAGGQGQAPNPAAVPNQIPTDEPFKTDDLTVKPSEPAAITTTNPPLSDAKPTTTATATTDATTDATPAATETTEPAKPPTDYTAHIPPSTYEGEAERRRKRAERFGIVTTAAESDTAKAAAADAIKALERAKKFGTGEGKPVVKGLDEALPERSKKRERSREDEGGRGGKRSMRSARLSARRSGGGGGGGRETERRTRSRGAEGKTGMNGGKAMVDGDAKAKLRAEDLRKAEERKKKFGT